jgi:hypothetical protein
MFYLKNKYFTRWAREEGITDHSLWEAIREFESGLFEANLGNHLYKKRIALVGRGKSGGSRTILFYQKGQKLLFCYGFKKNQQHNLSSSEFKALNKLSDEYQGETEETVLNNIKNKAFIEISKIGE